MTLFASKLLSGRRPDQLPAVLHFDAVGPIEVDAERVFTKRTGRRHASHLVRLSALFTPGPDVSAASFSVSLGSVRGSLVYDEGAWSVTSPDAEGDAVPVAESQLLEGVEYAVSLTVDVADGLYRDVVVDGQRVSPQVVDLIDGPDPVEESYTVDVLTGGQVDPRMPEWAKEAIRTYDAEALLEIARQRGGRFDVTRMPARDVERVPRTAPLAVAEGDPVFTFSVEASGPLTVQRAWGVEV